MTYAYIKFTKTGFIATVRKAETDHIVDGLGRDHGTSVVLESGDDQTFRRVKRRLAHYRIKKALRDLLPIAVHLDDNLHDKIDALARGI